MQDALYNAWRALPGFRGDARFSTWLYRIVWRQCVDRTRRRRPLPLEEPAAAAGSGDDPQARVEALETREELERALRRLPVRYRTVLTLFYVEDLPIKEIAAIVELPVGTVKTHLHRARRELRKAVGAGGANRRRGRRPNRPAGGKAMTRKDEPRRTGGAVWRSGWVWRRTTPRTPAPRAAVVPASPAGPPPRPNAPTAKPSGGSGSGSRRDCGP